MTLYPVEGLKYVVREWDDCLNKVRITAVTQTAVTFQYADGVTHTVSPDYFVYGLNATGVK